MCMQYPLHTLVLFAYLGVFPQSPNVYFCGSQSMRLSGAIVRYTHASTPLSSHDLLRGVGISPKQVNHRLTTRLRELVTNIKQEVGSNRFTTSIDRIKFILTPQLVQLMCAYSCLRPIHMVVGHF